MGCGNFILHVFFSAEAFENLEVAFGAFDVEPEMACFAFFFAPDAVAASGPDAFIDERGVLSFLLGG